MHDPLTSYLDTCENLLSRGGQVATSVFERGQGIFPIVLELQIVWRPHEYQIHRLKIRLIAYPRKSSEKCTCHSYTVHKPSYNG